MKKIIAIVALIILVCAIAILMIKALVTAQSTNYMGENWTKIKTMNDSAPEKFQTEIDNITYTVEVLEYHWNSVDVKLTVFSNISGNEMSDSFKLSMEDHQSPLIIGNVLIQPVTFSRWGWVEIYQKIE